MTIVFTRLLSPTYCLQVWGGTNEWNVTSIFILQKRVTRIIKSHPFRARTSPYFDGWHIFQLCKYKVILFMFKYVNGLLPFISKKYFLTKMTTVILCTPLAAGRKAMKYNSVIISNYIADLMIIRVVIILLNVFKSNMSEQFNVLRYSWCVIVRVCIIRQSYL